MKNLLFVTMSALILCTGCGFPGRSKIIDTYVSYINVLSAETENGSNFKLSGQNFSGLVSVFIGDLPCTVTSTSTSEINCVVNASVDSASWGDIKIIDGNSVVSRPTTFTNDGSKPVGAKVFGRPDFITTATNYRGSLNGPGQLAYKSGKFFVVDAGNHRVLVWNGVISSTSDLPDYVIGQRDFNSITSNSGLSAAHKLGLNAPQGVCYDGTRLFVSDSSNNRILVWNSFDWSQASTQEPDFVLGQPDFTSSTSNNGAATSAVTTAKSLSNPMRIDCDANHLMVADRFSHRVLFWHGAITENFQSANAVFGQRDMTGNRSFAGQSYGAPGINYSNILIEPVLVMLADNGRVFIGNGQNSNGLKNHVLARIPNPGEDLTANNVIGSTTWTHGGPCNTLRIYAAAQAGDKFYYLNGRDHRFYYYDLTSYSNDIGLLPNTQGCTRTIIKATSTIGDPSGDRRGLNQMYFPYGMVAADGKMFVSNSSDHRIFVWNTLPTTDVISDWQYGQPHNEMVIANGNSLATPALFSTSTVSVSNSLFVLDGQNRLVKYPITAAAIDNSLPEVIYGQTTAHTRFANSGSSTTTVNGLSVSVKTAAKIYRHSQSGRFYISDRENNRVLVFSSIPTSSTTVPDFVVGQSTLTARTVSFTATGLNRPSAVCEVNDRIFVADTANHRVNSYPLINSDGATADFVLGQAGFNFASVNAGASATAASLAAPRDIDCSANYLIVADSDNNRVLIWNSLPTSTNQPADVVLGQLDMVTSLANQGLSSPTAATLNSPYSAKMISGKLYVSDKFNNRVLVWNSLPTTNGQSANYVIGQNNFTGSSANKGKTTSSIDSLNSPSDVTEFNSNRIVISDSNNRRTLVLPKR